MQDLPGKNIASRPLYFFWLCDCSGSMAADGKIQALNNAIREALPHMVRVAQENPTAELFLRALSFSSAIQWQTAQPIPVSRFTWQDLQAGGETAMGAALSTLSRELTTASMPLRGFPPVIVLVSDGQPTDDFEKGLRDLTSQPWGKKAIRLAVAIGRDADMEVLQSFIGNVNITPFEANNADQLAQMIRWTSTVVIENIIKPPSSDGDQTIISGIPTAEPPDSVEDVW